jgi:hypothetical protein
MPASRTRQAMHEETHERIMDMSNRIEELLSSAATEFENGRNPFETSWLSDHNVTIDECYDLSDRIAIIIRGFLKAPESVRLAILFLGNE